MSDGTAQIEREGHGVEIVRDECGSDDRRHERDEEQDGAVRRGNEEEAEVSCLARQESTQKENDDDGADQNQANSHRFRNNRCGPLELAAQSRDDDRAEPMPAPKEWHLSPSVCREGNRHLCTPRLVPVDALEEEFREGPYLPTHVPHLRSDVLGGLD